MKYFKKVEGEKVYLSPINLDDCELYVKWLNNPNITQYLDCNDSLITLSRERELLEKIGNEEFCFAIIRKEDDTLLGNVGVTKIDYKNGRGNLGIFIGEEENLSKGYGSEAIKLILDFVFKEIRLHSVDLTVFGNNPRAIKAYTKCGFKEFGRRHDAIFHNGEYIDLIYMEIINENSK
jgi:RimJ/RimL family protein N-acetyltransferase